MSTQLNHNSPTSIRQFLKSRGIAPRKRWGQNFLINHGAREKIIRLLDIAPGAKIWEIGPGLGAMSEIILQQTTHLTGFEIDQAFCRWLRESSGDRGMSLIAGDVMQTWKVQWELEEPDRVLGNLPYNTASAIIASFIETQCLAKRCVITVQDEVGMRMIASPRTKMYSSLSILCQTSSRMTNGGRLSPGSFYPAPRVNSRIIVLEPAAPYGDIHRPKILQMLVRTLFTARRKTLANNLNSAKLVEGFPNIDMVKTAFRDTGVKLDRRPETISPAEWVALANKVSSC